jgi:hypothetical protein
MGKRKVASATSGSAISDRSHEARRKVKTDEERAAEPILVANNCKRLRRSQKNFEEHCEDVVASESDLEENEEDHDDAPAASKYEVRDRVLARDEDGLLYHANIRRKMYGINHQKTVPCLKVFDSCHATKENSNTEGNPNDDAENDNDSNIGNETLPEWYYFVHFEGWKSLWDRWVSEADIMEASPLNVERMNEVMEANRTLQHEVKEKTKKRKIQNANLFMQLWRQKLDGLEEKWKQQDRKGDIVVEKNQIAIKEKKLATKKKKTRKSRAEAIKEEADLAFKSCLTNREQAHIQAIPLGFGLKRVLVEEWEILNSAHGQEDTTNTENKAHDSMVHVLPARVTIRDALSMYLKEKGIKWDGIATKAISTSKGKDKPYDHGENKEHHQAKSHIFVNEKEENNGSIADSVDVLKPMSERAIDNNKSPGDDSRKNGTDVASPPKLTSTQEDQLTKEWKDMANGISIYFEQALTNRLLYPSEVSQLILLEESLGEESSLNKIDIYGCEHLLRLISILPKILDQQYQDAKQQQIERMRDSVADEYDCAKGDDVFAHRGSLILAKLQDLARFLQKNQSTLFCSRYRKKNDTEVSLEHKIQKRQERRRKNQAAMMLQQDGIGSMCDDNIAMETQ